MVHPISTRGFTEKESKEPKNQKNKEQKNGKMLIKKTSPRGFEPKLSDTRYLLRGAEPSLLTTQTWRYFCRQYHRWRYFWAVMPYGGNFLAVGGFSFFGGNGFGGGGKTKVWR